MFIALLKDTDSLLGICFIYLLGFFQGKLSKSKTEEIKSSKGGLRGKGESRLFANRFFAGQFTEFLRFHELVDCFPRLFYPCACGVWGTTLTICRVSF